MNENNNDHEGTATQAIQNAVQDSQILVTYIAVQDSIDLNKKALDTVIKSKYLLQQNKWNQKAEVAFWLAFEEISKSISPVTIESLKSTMPYVNVSGTSGRTPVFPKFKEANKTILRFRVLAILTLIPLLFAQIYWIVGANVNQKLKTLFVERQEVRAKIDEMKNLKGLNLVGKYLGKTGDPAINELIEKNTTYNQVIDANFHVLLSWNKVWQFLLVKKEYEPKLRPYRTTMHHAILTHVQDSDSIEQKRKVAAGGAAKGNPKSPVDIRSFLLNMKLKYAAMIARDKLFVEQLNAAFVLTSLHTYFLPLLYGLMGAIMYTLRAITNEMKNFTYEVKSEIRYRLRVYLGALSGLIIGLFLKPENVESANMIAPMAISFLAGYNVELLFSLMDRIIKQFVAGSSDVADSGSPKPAA
jgi:hypothetical protein